MFTQLTGLVLKIDKILLAAALALSVIIIFYALIKEARRSQRRRHLQEIRRHLQDMTRTGRADIEETMPVFVDGYSPQEFIDLARDRELELPQEVDQRIRDYFASGAKIEQIESAARKTGNKWRRIEAIISLGYVNSPGAAEILKRSLYSADEDMSYYSLRALGQIKNNAAARILLEFLGVHADSGYNIALTLETFPPEIAEELFQALESPLQPVRYWALKVIGKFKFQGNNGRVTRIIELSRDDNADVRAAACECLGGLDAPGIKEALTDRLGDKFWFVRMHAVRALDNVLGPLSLPAVAKLIKDPSWKVKEGVKNIMVQNITAALPYIEDNLAHGDEPTCRACADALIDSGYILIILKHLLSGQKGLEEKAAHLLAGLIKCKIYFGLKKAVDNFVPEEQTRLLQVITALDGDTARRIIGEPA